MSALPKIADFISRFEFSFLCFLAFSVPFSNHTLRDFKEEISNNLLRFCIYLLFSLRRFLLYLLSLLLISSDTRSFLQRIFFISSLVCRSFLYLLSKIFQLSYLFSKIFLSFSRSALGVRSEYKSPFTSCGHLVSQFKLF